MKTLGIKSTVEMSYFDISWGKLQQFLIQLQFEWAFDDNYVQNLQSNTTYLECKEYYYLNIAINKLMIH